MRIGLVGYGTGGRHFHAPFIQAAKGVELAGVVARAPATVAAVQAGLPGVQCHASLTAMIHAGGIDAVTITTPPQTRRALVLEAIAAGLSVIADKSFAPDAEGARELDRAARQKGVILGAYHNRRWNSDFRTLHRLIGDGRLGRVWRVHSRMDFDEQATLEASPVGGLLRDLGSHLVDQMVYLLGPVAAVDAQLDVVARPQGATDASFTITLRHSNGAHSHLSASKLNHLHMRELRAYGDEGSYVALGSDIQAQSLFAGRRPADDPGSWGFEPEANWGTLRTGPGAKRIPAEQGRYHDYYEAFAAAVRTAGPPPVTAEEATSVIAILDAARLSAIEGRSVPIN